MKNTNSLPVGSIVKTNRDGDVEVLEIRKGQKALIRFLNTGTKREVLIANLLKGKAADPSITCRKVEPVVVYLGTHHSSNTHGDFILLEKAGDKCIIQFVDTGYTMQCLYGNLIAGKVRDPYRKTNYSRGYMGEYKRLSYTNQAIQLWRNMLKRCYSEKDLRGYSGVSVDDRWLCFSNFQEDLPKLKNFNGWLEGQKPNREKYNLDKDFLFPGNMVYSRDVCVFLPESLNKALTSRTTEEKWAEINELCLRSCS